LLEAWRDIRKRAAELDRQLLAAARQNQAIQLLMTIPGVGAVTAVSYVAAIEDPANFKTSRSVGAWLGLTTRRYQSGEVDYGPWPALPRLRHVRSFVQVPHAADTLRPRFHKEVWFRSRKESRLIVDP
jgi:transposase